MIGPKDLGESPQTPQGHSALAPFAQERSLLRGQGYCIWEKITACERGIIFPNSQTVFVFHSISASANACIRVCHNGVKGMKSPCGGIGGGAPKVFSLPHRRNPHRPGVISEAQTVALLQGGERIRNRRIPVKLEGLHCAVIHGKFRRM